MSTIVAISTAPGIGGIGIVRMSGKDTFSILEKIFKPKQQISEIKGYQIKYGHIVDISNGEIIDEVLVSYFKSPKSYTTEDMCEINSHGGTLILKNILELCLKHGAELAEPGEFTKRAFLNGRIDLSQAESVIDIINAKTQKEAKASNQQLQGQLSKKIQEIRQEILNIMVNIEVSIDYPEYDVEEVSNAEALKKLDDIFKKLEKLKTSFTNGKIIKEGIKVAIIGRPNAGKSSLLNALLKEDRAIVTKYEGTTRDTIEESICVDGIPLILIDTAGIREANDEVEKIGIQKSKQMIESADLVIFILDSTKELQQEDKEILEQIKEKNAIIVLNKIDLNMVISEETEEIKQTKKETILISALKEQGIENIYKTISEMFQLNKINLDNEITVTNIRHQDLIEKAIISTQKAKNAILQQMPIDIVSIEIKEILENLGKITGDNVTEDIIKEIFKNFCLGK